MFVLLAPVQLPRGLVVITPFLVRGGIVVLLVIFIAGLLPGLAGFRPGEREAEAAFLNEVKKLTASDADYGDIFGESAAVSGNTAVVGAYQEVAGSYGAGAAYVFERDEGGTDNWGEVKKLLASDADVFDEFGTRVAISGNPIVVGARLEDARGDNAGAAYVFRRDEGGADNWGEVRKLTASDAESWDSFGRSVAVSGDTAVVGASLEDTGGPSAGAAYVFQRDEGGADNWGEVTKLTASDATAGAAFGSSVALSGDTAVVGASVEGAGGYGAGAAYVFARGQGGADNWGEVTKLTASDAEGGDRFGLSVALGKNTVAVGAWGEETEGYAAGAAYVYRRGQGGADNWGEVKKLTASDAEVLDQFGVSVAVSGDTVVVGAHAESAGGKQAGAAYVYRRDQGGADNWGEVKKLTASDAQAGDLFGWRVAVSGDTAVVGALQKATGDSWLLR